MHFTLLASVRTATAVLTFVTALSCSLAAADGMNDDLSGGGEFNSPGLYDGLLSNHNGVLDTQHFAELSASTAQQANLAITKQNGNDNTLTQEQYGEGNAAYTAQLGEDHYSSVTQVGNNNQSHNVQYGTGNAFTAVQYGSANTIDYTQTGANLGVTIIQQGVGRSITVWQNR